MKKIWSKEDTDYLIKNYEYTKTSDMMKVLKNKTRDQIRWKAKSFNLNKKVSKSKTNISILQNLDDIESLYLWGLLTADGCFNKRQIILCLHEKDEDCIKYCAKKFNCNIGKQHQVSRYNPNGCNMLRITLEDKFILPKIIDRFNIKLKKTYNPFDISEFLTKNRLLYFLIGIIDGDGYISNIPNYSIKIKTHISWYDNYYYIKNKLYDLYKINSNLIINKKGFIEFSITNKKDIFKIYKYSLLLPYKMERKWLRIQEYKGFEDSLLKDLF